MSLQCRSKTGPHKHTQTQSVTSQLQKHTVKQFCLVVFEHSLISRRFSSLSVVQWACCHQINETLWAAVPELKHTHRFSSHVVALIVCLCCIVAVCVDKTTAHWCWKQHVMWLTDKLAKCVLFTTTDVHLFKKKKNDLDLAVYDTKLLFREKKSCQFKV